MPKYILEDENEEEKPVKIWLKKLSSGDIMIMMDDIFVAYFDQDGGLNLVELSMRDIAILRINPGHAPYLLVRSTYVE